MSENIVDFLIIGAGAAGAAAAYNLADTGTSILCLEQGDWNKQSSYPSNYMDWEYHNEKSMSISPNIRNNKSDYPINDYDNSPISIANHNAVGEVLFNLWSFQDSSLDFKANLDGVADDWPIDYFT